jgi:formylglycine-generating enzyme
LMRQRALRLCALGALLSSPLACADLLGLEAGVLATGGSGSGQAGGEPVAGSEDGAGGNGAAGGGAVLGGADLGGSAGEAGGTAGGAPHEPVGGGGNDTPCVDGVCERCPADMVQSQSQDGVAYCIDIGEVTNQYYLAFTKQNSRENYFESPPECAGNISFVPDEACGGALTDVPSRKLPVVCVDYCDAEAYCHVHGKRLCGRVGGTMNDPIDDVDAFASEWYAACAGPNEYLYPYGDVASASACNASGYAPSDMGPRDLETMTECEGGVPGLFNMSGNVAEWERSCSSTFGSAACSTRGGSFVDGPYEVRCAGAIAMQRLEASVSVGFRCCAGLAQ